MSLQPGDVVNLSATVPIALTQYDRIKAHASVTRVISDDVERDLQEMDASVRVLLFRSARAQILPLSMMLEAVENEGLDGLLRVCEEVIAEEALPQVARVPAPKKPRGAVRRSS